MTGVDRFVLMEYDTKLWNQYTEDNKGTEQKQLSDFIFYNSISLGAKKICEAGCNVGNNLSSFTQDYDVCGIDMNEQALASAQNRYPEFRFKQENLKKISFADDSFDVVFTRGVLIHIPDEDLDDVLSELLRISKKWVFNLEYFGEDGKMIEWKRGDNLLWYRNMLQRWQEYPVQIVSDAEIPSHIDSGKTRYTLVKKNPA
ncbi:MAG: class I SAM-dependent methyltransferase [Nitrosarchaeum sp.]|nr:class I SAM-dependent methyltransferase [Nitrosarchaeum sp.]